MLEGCRVVLGTAVLPGSEFEETWPFELAVVADTLSLATTVSVTVRVRIRVSVETDMTVLTTVTVTPSGPD